MCHSLAIMAMALDEPKLKFRMEGSQGEKHRDAIIVMHTQQSSFSATPNINKPSLKLGS